MIPAVTGFSVVVGIILLTMYRIYQDLRTRCNDNADRLQGQPDLAFTDVKKRVRDCDLLVESIKHQATVSDRRIDRIEETTKELHGLYGSCHNVAKKAYEVLLEQKPKDRHPRGRTQPGAQGPYQLDFGTGTWH